MGTLHHADLTDLDRLNQQLHGSPRERANAIVAAARTGLPHAQTLLGQILLNGQGIEQDQALAIKWFKIAASQGDAMAFNMLGRCYEHGWHLDKDESMAAACFLEAANLKLDWGLYNLANLYATGRGVAQDDQRAFALYQQAALAGHAKSMNLLGRCYEDGLGVPADAATALSWYRRSAEAGDFRGQYSLATVLLSQGEIEHACHWLELALQGGNLNFLRATRSALRQTNQARLRHFAQRFYQRAAELGDASDQALLRQFEQPARSAEIQ
ncbi:sel1 repeat family protein [Pseudomonas sp. 5P_3.1_Bac2]|uniref:sel1 repeat family protein n=1 Tax=Pseudomonas sp. 5P_3.1_Bac2 TaxID=2971617 RepID=UPI0021C82D3D|nr:sel1 repeat family protein [Pseudomonas sp. 5P_3.1_Bac2]MCU1718103.1 sel1 repeat family protein [Pseudomonas sp. 5P_3.1_Bac2]